MSDEKGHGRYTKSPIWFWARCQDGIEMLRIASQFEPDDSPGHRRITMVVCEIARTVLPLVKKGESKARIAMEMAYAWASGSEDSKEDVLEAINVADVAMELKEADAVVQAAQDAAQALIDACEADLAEGKKLDWDAIAKAEQVIQDAESMRLEEIARNKADEVAVAAKEAVLAAACSIEQPTAPFTAEQALEATIRSGAKTDRRSIKAKYADMVRKIYGGPPERFIIAEEKEKEEEKPKEEWELD